MDNLLSQSELAEAAGVRPSTIKFYSQEGILPYKQKGPRLRKNYKKDESLKLLKEITNFKVKRMTIAEMKKIRNSSKNKIGEKEVRASEALRRNDERT